MNKKTLIAFIVIVLIVLAVVYWDDITSSLRLNTASEQASQPDASGPEDNPQASVNPPADQTESDIKAAFPAGFPFEDGARDFRGFFVELNAGETQYVFTYTSGLSRDQNYETFRQYVQGGGFQEADLREGETEGFYFGLVGANELAVDIQQTSEEIFVTGFYTVRGE